MAELNVNHTAQVALTVTTVATPTLLPIRQLNSGIPATDASGRPLYLNPRHALIYIGGQPIRWRADGVAPEAAPGMGMYQAAGSYIDWTNPLGDYSALLDRVQFVRAENATANAALEISFFN